MLKPYRTGVVSPSGGTPNTSDFQSYIRHGNKILSFAVFHENYKKSTFSPFVWSNSRQHCFNHLATKVNFVVAHPKKYINHFEFLLFETVCAQPIAMGDQTQRGFLFYYSDRINFFERYCLHTHSACYTTKKITNNWAAVASLTYKWQIEMCCIYIPSDPCRAICCKSCLCVFECDPNPLAFPCQNNDLKLPNHTQQYHSVRVWGLKSWVWLSWLLSKTPKYMTSAFWFDFYASLRRKTSGAFSCSGTYLICPSMCPQ